MDISIIKTRFEFFFTGILGKTADYAAGSAANAPGKPQNGSPFVLVSHAAGGTWEVFAQDFDHSLATFDARQVACDYASELARTNGEMLVLIRDPQKSTANLHARVAPRALPSFFVRMGRE